MDWWYAGGMWFWSLLILAFLVAVGWYLAAVPRRRLAGPDVPSETEETLERRYAEGEIDQETYERRLTELRK